MTSLWPECPITGNVLSTPFVLPAALCNVLTFPQKAVFMHHSKSVFFNTLCSENRTKPANKVHRVTTHDINAVPPSGPRLSYSPVGLENKVSESVCEYLAWCEANEPDVWLRDDIRIAWLTVLNAAEGKLDPWRYSFWMYLGRTPEKLIPLFVERAERHRLMEVPDYDPTVKMAQAPAAAQKRKEIA